LITVQHFLYKANLNATFSNKDIHCWSSFNYNERMTRGESLELERTISISTILGGSYFSTVGIENFVWPEIFQSKLAILIFVKTAYTQSSIFILLRRAFCQTVCSVSLCSFLHILNPTILNPSTLSAIIYLLYHQKSGVGRPQFITLRSVKTGVS
jgi:hypothetical protein